MNDTSFLLATRGLTKEYHREGAPPIAVLNNVDFVVERHDKIAILGKSGAGKSTLLHILGTLEAPSRGSVTFDGHDVFKFNESQLSSFRNQKLGFVFQFHYLMLEFNALENVMMPALVGKMARGEARARAESLLDRVGLKDRMTHKASQLSGGEQQRVAIARALMMRPRLLLTDEMTGNLDPVTGRNVFDLVQSIHDEVEMAIVSVTHDERLAQSYPKVYRLEAGQLHAQ